MTRAGARARRAGQSEIHLLLEAVHLGHLHLELVSQLNHAPGAPAHEQIPLHIEDKKVIGDCGQRHQPAHRESGHIHEEAEVPHVRDQRGIAHRLTGCQLRLEEGEELHVLAIALGVGGIALGVGDMLGGLHQRLRGARLFLKERPMHHEIGVAADRRGEVGVFLLGQTVVAERLDGVARPHERLEKANLERLPDRNCAELLQELLDLGLLAQVAARHVVAENFLAILRQAPLFRLFVDAVNRLQVQLHQARRHRLVRQQHELFDQLVRNVVLHPLDARDPALFVEPDFALGKIQVERAGLEAQPPDALGQLVRVVQHARDRVRRFRLQERHYLAVTEAPLGMNHRREEPRLQHLAVVGHEKLDALGQAVHLRFERAQLIAQRLGQHRDDAIHEIRRVAPPTRLVVQRGAGANIMRDVRDVDPQLPALGRDAFQADRVVEILRVIGIDRHHLVAPAIFAAGQVSRLNHRSDRPRFLQHRLRKMQHQVVLPQHREHVHAFFIRRAEHFDDFALGVRVP